MDSESWLRIGNRPQTSVRQHFLSLLKRVEALEACVDRDSSSSSRQPSTDSPAKKRQRRTTTAERRKPGAKLGYAGHPQVLLEPTVSVSLFPEVCACGQGRWAAVILYHAHQVIEFPVIRPRAGCDCLYGPIPV